MTYDDDRWISATQALRELTDWISARLGIDKNEAWREAASAILGRLTAGTLRAAPKGFLWGYNGQEFPEQYWFHLRQNELDGSASPHPPTMDLDSETYCIPAEFWHVFKEADGTGRADWVSGDFYITNFGDRSGGCSGVARDVHFDRKGLPEAELMAAGHSDWAQRNDERSDPPKNKGGRPAKYDWHGAIAHLVALASRPDGLDPTGKGKELNVPYISHLMEDWFDTQGVGRPGDSQLRKFAAIVVGAINDLRDAQSAARK